VQELSQLTKVEVLDLSFNKLSDIEKLKMVLVRMRSLRVVSVEGNTLAPYSKSLGKNIKRTT
jgi:Leucine-rich repeat (LRR) protein